MENPAWRETPTYCEIFKLQARLKWKPNLKGQGVHIGHVFGQNEG
jgi:hypothetical protein